MCKRPAWLPEELHYSAYGGDWDRFLADVYSIFEHDFKQSVPSFQAYPLDFDKRIQNGKEAAFWHIIQREDPGTHEKVPDFRRCERISWIRSLIEHSTDSSISVWENTRKRETSILIWLEQLDYVVIMRKRPRVIILVTGFRTDISSVREKMIKERDEYYQKMQKPPL